ncbi:MAG: hypothetical protein V1756_03035 [Patescibacteria group bacterium]
MKFLEKIQNLPLKKKKIILWALMIIIGGTLFIWYIEDVQEKFGSLNIENLKEGLGLPRLQEELNNLPKLEIPGIEFSGTSSGSTSSESAETE